MNEQTPLGPRQQQVLCELRKRATLTARQAEHVIRAADMLGRYQEAESLHGSDDPWVADLRQQILRRLDRLDTGATDLGYSADGQRILTSLERRGLATQPTRNTWAVTDAGSKDDDGEEWDWLLGDLLRTPRRAA